MNLATSYNVKDYYDFFEEIDLGPDFIRNIYAFCHTPPLPHYLRNWELYICKQEENPVAICGLYENKTDALEVIWLSWFGVRKNYKRKGIGTFMISEIFEKCRIKDKKQLYLTTNRDNYAAIDFYLRNGFTHQGDASKFLSEAIDDPLKIVMKKELC